MNRYRFQISGYVEVLAASENDAIECVQTNNYGVKGQRVMTSCEKKDTAFWFAVPIACNPELIKDQNSTMRV